MGDPSVAIFFSEIELLWLRVATREKDKFFHPTLDAFLYEIFEFFGFIWESLEYRDRTEGRIVTPICLSDDGV